MVSFCWTTWDDYLRLFVRLNVIAVSSIGCYWYGIRAFGKSRFLGLVPRLIYAFLFALFAYLLVAVSWYVITCHRFLDWQERTLYGLSLIWIIAIQLATAIKVSAALELIHDKANRYKDYVEQAASQEQSGDDE